MDHDAKLLALAIERMASTDLSEAVPEESALKELGVNRAELDDMEDVEIE